MNGRNPGNMLTFEAMARMARSLGLEVFQVPAQSPAELDAAFAQIARSRAEAVSIYEDPLFTAQAPQLAALAERSRLRSIGFREFAEAVGSWVSASISQTPGGVP